jgi:hypothetical protein
LRAMGSELGSQVSRRCSQRIYTGNRSLYDTAKDAAAAGFISSIVGRGVAGAQGRPRQEGCGADRRQLIYNVGETARRVSKRDGMTFEVGCFLQFFTDKFEAYGELRACRHSYATLARPPVDKKCRLRPAAARSAAGRKLSCSSNMRCLCWRVTVVLMSVV